LIKRISLAALLSLPLACKGETPIARNADQSSGANVALAPQVDDAAVQKAPVSKDECPLAVRPLKHPPAKRIVALGDVHGDLEATRRALRLAGAIDASDRWIGGALVLVQTGDILDRGDGEQAILELFATLKDQAEEAGGAIHRLNGNHEFMNAMGDFRYVTRAGFSDFETPETISEPPTMRARAEAFLPGGDYAKRLASFDTVTMVGDTVFAHGGVLPRFVDSLEQVNRDSRCFLLGLMQPPEAIMDPEGPIWSRAFSTGDSACEELTKTLESLSAKRMVVGHTPQLTGITSACDDKVWRIDTGMADFYRGPTEVLEIIGDDVRRLK
jgi:hypothetical protein